MTNLVLSLLLCFGAGVGLGILFFGGLWLTVRALSGVRHPALLMSASLVLRLAITLTGFYLVLDGRWERLAAALAGFLLVRGFLRWRIGPPLPNHPASQA